MYFRWLTESMRRAGSALMPDGDKRPAAGTADKAAPTHRSASRARDPDRAYVSEFTRFMEGFMDEHPEAEREQRSGWAMYWNRKVDFARQDEAARDTIPTDGYYYFAAPPAAAPDGDTAPGRG